VTLDPPARHHTGHCCAARRPARQLPRQHHDRPTEIQVGIGHAGRTVTVEADTTFRVYDGEQSLIDEQVARSEGKTTASINF
jgi:hypothetical protein